jgi:hypothetical protein
MRGSFLAAGVGAWVCAMVSACLDRPVGEVNPHTSNLFVAPIENQVIDKLDLLFMIDNSRSMGDKQALLAKAVPQLVDRLVVPRCVNEAGEIHVRAELSEACPVGMQPEFRAVRDIHVAVITSSLGGHGGTVRVNDKVVDVCGEAESDDHAHLLPSVREGLSSYNGSGFLAWDPQQKLTPPGESDAQRLGQQFGQMVTKAGEIGCGYESSLESWYRFLVDPEPPLRVTVQDGHSVVQDVDQAVLAQRKAFLRPDSLVAIVMLTDENDCSIRDDGYGFMLASGAPMQRASSSCAKDPNDPCCTPCGATSVAKGCPALADDPACKQGKTFDPHDKLDPPNLRCLENKRRFGVDLLYPASRYIDALTKREVVQRSTGQLVKNPLFDAPSGMLPRQTGLVFLAGIVGVPWQDIADDASLKGPGLRYLSATELAARGRWDVVVGDASRNQPPQDPFMHESREPRSGVNPITLDAISPASSLNPQQNPINGHEQNNLDGEDLQYACTFRLGEPETCTDNTCDCASTDMGVTMNNSPLCQPPEGGPASAIQRFGKAYPGLRPLEVLRGIGESAIVASICPKVLEPGRPGYGYEPAVDAIVERLKVALSARCLPRPLAVEAGSTGKLPCVVVEAAPPGQGPCTCDAGARRQPASSEAQQLVREQLKERLNCDTSTTPSCTSYCMCELSQAEGAALDQCLNDVAGSDTPGYCYVDPYGAEPHGNPKLVEACDATSRQLIRFVGPDTPRPNAVGFLACLGATLD